MFFPAVKEKEIGTGESDRSGKERGWTRERIGRRVAEKEREACNASLTQWPSLACCAFLSLSLFHRNRTYLPTYPLPRVSIYHPSLSPSCVFLNLDPPSKIWNGDSPSSSATWRFLSPILSVAVVFFHSPHLHLSGEGNLPGKQSRSLERDRITVIHPRPWEGWERFLLHGKETVPRRPRRRRGWRIRDWKSEDSRLVFESFIIGGECHPSREEGRFVSIFHLFG